MALRALAAASVALPACGDTSLDLAAKASEVFSDESVWHGDDHYVTVTITERTVLSTLDLEVYLEQLGFSPAAYERMNRTRALDGTQSATGVGVNAMWTYHPDNGLQVVFEREVVQ